MTRDLDRVRAILISGVFKYADDLVWFFELRVDCIVVFLLVHLV